MLNDIILFEDLIEYLKRTAAVNHVVFRDDLKPVHYRLLAQDVPVVRNPQSNSNAVFGKAVKAIRRHCQLPGGKSTKGHA